MSIKNCILLYTYIKMVQFSVTQRRHFFNFSSETCLFKKVQYHGSCKFCSFPQPWVGFSKSLGVIFQNPGWDFPKPWLEFFLPPLRLSTPKILLICLYIKYVIVRSINREAAKKVILLMAVPLRPYPPPSPSSFLCASSLINVRLCFLRLSLY